MFTEIVALQELLDAEKLATAAVGRDFAEISERLLKKQGELVSLMDGSRRKESMTIDLRTGLNSLAEGSPAPGGVKLPPSSGELSQTKTRRDAVKEVGSVEMKIES